MAYKRFESRHVDANALEATDARFTLVVSVKTNSLTVQQRIISALREIEYYADSVDAELLWTYSMERDASKQFTPPALPDPSPTPAMMRIVRLMAEGATLGEFALSQSDVDAMKRLGLISSRRALTAKAYKLLKGASDAG